MFRFFRHIRHKLFNQGKVSRYLGYAIGEIVLIVVGILIALEMSDWKASNQREEERTQLLRSLKLETEANIANLDETIAIQEKVLEAIRTLVSVHNEKTEQSTGNLAPDIFDWASTYYRIRPNFAAYDAMIATGSGELLTPVLALQLATNKTHLTQGQMDEWLAEIAFVELLNTADPYGGWMSFMSEASYPRNGLPFVDRHHDLEGLIKDGKFVEQLLRRLIPENNITTFYGDQREALKKTLSLIQAELAP